MGTCPRELPTIPHRASAAPRRWNARVGRRTRIGLCVALLTVAAGVTTFFVWQHLEELRQLRAGGLQAAVDGQHVVATDKLARYLRARPDDTPALYRYALSRREVPAARGAHLREAIAALKRCCLSQPDDPQAWKALAKTNAAAGSWSDAVLAARQALALGLEDAETHCLLAASLAAGQQYAASVEQLDAALLQHPEALTLHLLRLDQWHREGRSPAEFRSYAAQGLEPVPEPGRSIVTSAALLLAADQAAASQRLQGLLQQPWNDIEPEFVRSLVTLLADSGLIEPGLQFLCAHPELLADPFVRVWFVRRCWECQHPDWIVEHVSAGELNLATDPEPALYLTASLNVLGRQPQADLLLGGLAADLPTTAARGWYRVCELQLRGGIADAREALEAARGALEIVPTCPLLYEICARNWLQLGEYQLAAKAARTVVDLAVRGRTAKPSAVPPPGADIAGDRAPVISPRPAPTSIAEWDALLKQSADPVRDLRSALASNGAGQDADLADQLIKRLEAATPSDATTWRLHRARWLLTHDSSQSVAADAVILLKPVLQALPDHSDARLLRIVALARMGNHAYAEADLLTLVEMDPSRTSDALRLVLHCREEACWPDSTRLVEMWCRSARLEAHAWKQAAKDGGARKEPLAEHEDSLGGGATSAPADPAIDRLLILAEYAEQRQDSALAEATYRRLLQIVPGLPVACNNLAVLLAPRPEQAAEARRLAECAVAAAPDDPAYLDTLADLTTGSESAP